MNRNDSMSHIKIRTKLESYMTFFDKINVTKSSKKLPETEAGCFL